MSAEASASSSEQKQWGVTEAISLSKPSEKDERRTKELEETLRKYDRFEKVESQRKRQTVLGKLNQIVSDWCAHTLIKKGVPESYAREAGAKIYTFGSYRLGVNAPGADIDTLCLCPRKVTREDFFQGLHPILATQPEITEITPIPGAIVPIIAFNFSDIPIDLAFCALDLATIPASLEITKEDVLRNLDEKAVMSINGVRVATKMLQLVPNVEVFSLALRCIKYWSACRGVSSNKVGYLGGIAWALMTARICQLYPNASASTIVSRFFMVYDKWEWGSSNPVVLCRIERSISLRLKVWDPSIYQQDERHIMPVITPSYPSMNSTHNVSDSTHMVIKKEIKRGAELMFDIEAGKKTWDDLFTPFTFFEDYNIFVQVDAIAANEEDLLKWSGYVESRLRHLAIRFARYGSDYLKFAPPNPQSFVNSDQSNCKSFFLGLVVEVPKEGVDDPAEVAQARMRGRMPTLDLNRDAEWFKDKVYAWDTRTEGMEVNIRAVRRRYLPDFVFPDGDRPDACKPRAKKPKKKKKKKGKKKKDKTNVSEEKSEQTAAEAAPKESEKRKRDEDGEEASVEEDAAAVAATPEQAVTSDEPETKRTKTDTDEVAATSTEEPSTVEDKVEVEEATTMELSSTTTGENERVTRSQSITVDLGDM